MTDLSEWGDNIPGRPEDWPPLTPASPHELRELARWFTRGASRWSGLGFAGEWERAGDALFAQAEAIENGDRDAWLEALEAQARAMHG